MSGGVHAGASTHVAQGIEVTLDMLGILVQLAGAVIANNLRVALEPKTAKEK